MYSPVRMTGVTCSEKSARAPSRYSSSPSRNLAGSPCRSCRARHERQGLPARFLEGLDEYLDGARALFSEQVTPVILTGEYIPENYLIEETPSGWKLAGLIDFGDVMTGLGVYDLLGPSSFMGGGKPGRIRSLLKGFGYPDAKLGPELSRRLMTLFLLHRYSDPANQILIEGWQERASNLDELERLLWPL